MALGALIATLSPLEQAQLVEVYDSGNSEEAELITEIFLDCIKRVDYSEKVSNVDKAVFLPTLISAWIFREHPSLIAIFAALYSNIFASSKTVHWHKHTARTKRFYKRIHQALDTSQVEASAEAQAHLREFFDAGATAADVAELLGRFKFTDEVFKDTFRRGLSRVQTADDFLLLFALTRNDENDQFESFKQELFDQHFDYLTTMLKPSLAQMRLILRAVTGDEEKIAEYMKRLVPSLSNEDIAHIFEDENTPDIEDYRKEIASKLNADLAARLEGLSYNQSKAFIANAPDRHLVFEARLNMLNRAQTPDQVIETLFGLSPAEEKAINNKSLRANVRFDVLLMKFATSKSAKLNQWTYADGVGLLERAGREHRLNLADQNHEVLWTWLLSQVRERGQLRDFLDLAPSSFVKKHRSTIEGLGRHLSARRG